MNATLLIVRVVQRCCAAVLRAHTNNGATSMCFGRSDGQGIIALRKEEVLISSVHDRKLSKQPHRMVNIRTMCVSPDPLRDIVWGMFASRYCMLM